MRSLAVISIILMLSSVITILSGPTPLGSGSNITVADDIDEKISPDLAGPLSGNPNEINLMIRFVDGPTLHDLNMIRELNFKVGRTFHAVPALSVRGPASAIEALVDYPRIEYVEHNDPVVLDMEMGTRVINATRVWSSLVETASGPDKTIDGTGVTVCVVDTGIDAGHPDLDYHSKTIMNVYDPGDGRWTDAENTDTNYGHGTHVAGTVAGNGDASAGARRGVAPGANLIGITVSIPEEAQSPYEDGYIQGLEWVYDHSRPGANPDNIRCVTNSWHSTVTEYDPDSLLTKVIEKLTFENNVVSTWSAGNDGRDDPEGNELTTSGQGNAPVAIMVAAYERDGSAVTDFSSRGRVGANHTYPDIGAPGRSIWSCSARRTVISGASYVGGNRNPYYLAISGTSMSTPHVAGLTALLWQACPSMSMSPMHEDYSGDDPEWWYSDPRTRIHDVEWILEASARFLPPTSESGNVGGDTNSTGWWGKPIDYVQGYGIVDARRAVGIALTLQALRDRYPGINVTVGDAIGAYDGQEVAGTTIINVSRSSAMWSGEYSRYNDQAGNPLSAVNQTKYVRVPNGAQRAVVTLKFTVIDLEEFRAGDLAFTIDVDGDGSVDHRSDLGLSGSQDMAVIDVNGPGTWVFGIEGMGVRVPRPLKDVNYVELRMEYDMSVVFDHGSGGNHSLLVPDAYYAPAMPVDGMDGDYSLTVMQYDTRHVELVEEKEMEGRERGVFPWWMIVVVVGSGFAAGGAVVYRKRKSEKSK